MLRRLGSSPAAFFVWIILSASLGWLAGHAAESDDEHDDDRSPKELARDEVKLADEAIRAAWEAFRAGRVNLAGARVDRWSLRRVESLRETGASSKKLVAAWQLHRDQMEALAKLAKSHYDSGQATLLDHLEAQYALTHAKRELAKAQAEDKNGDNDAAGDAANNASDKRDGTISDEEDGHKNRGQTSDDRSPNERNENQRDTRGQSRR